jgi:predicted house-cleaning NTP pyrophosphatase (Maf/HAM1 superfamily)
MLLWQVIVNGTGFDSSQDDWLDDRSMQDLKERNLVLDTAKSKCESFLNENHYHEVELFSSVTEALDDTLHPDPSERQSAKSILEKLKHTIED